MRVFITGLVLAGIMFSCAPAFAWSEKPAAPATPQTSSALAPDKDYALLSKNLGHSYSLGLEGTSAPASGPVSDISQLNTYSLGLSVNKADIAVKGDGLKLEIAKPLAVAGANGKEALTGTADEGNPAFPQGLTPGGRETDINILYTLPLNETTIGSVSLTTRRDADNIQGQSGVAGMVRLRHRF